MLNPTWLNTFATLIDTGHFTKTAEKLFMTQPGVSQHINKLEQACGHPLIHREKKKFELTEQGRLVYQYATQLEKNEQALLTSLSFDDPYAGHYSLACSGALALTLFPRLLQLQTQHRGLVPKLKAAPNQQIVEDISKGLIDLGIVTHIPNPSLFDVETLGQEPLCLVLPAKTKTSHDDLSWLNELGLINHPDAEHYLSLYCAQNQDSNFKDLNIGDIPISGDINQISQILQPVARGLGFTLLPKSAVDSFEDARQLQLFKPQQPVMETLYRVKKRNRPLPARFTIINATLQAHFSPSESESEFRM